MALETLRGVKEIGGFKVCHKYLNGEAIAMVGVDEYIEINHEENSILFALQNGPVKENGINGCHPDTMIEAAKIIIEGLNKNFPCRENAVAITKLDEALMWLEKRKKDREKRGVEGTNQA